MTETAKTNKREYYKVLIISPPGKGKTFSFRNVNPDTIGFMNIENKPLPFKNNFKYHFRPDSKSGDPISKDRVDINNTLVAYAKNPEIEAIGFDSLSAYMDMLLNEARATKKGYDIWNFYNEELGKFFTLVKKIQKEVIITCHYEILGIEGNQEKRAKVKGKEWEGLIEKEFTIVLYGDNKFQDNGTPEYFFKTAEENASAKCPPGIFGEGTYKIPNDAKVLLEKIAEFAK